MELSGRFDKSVDEFDRLTRGELILEFTALATGEGFLDDVWLADGEGFLEWDLLNGGEFDRECIGEKRGDA